jgi:hypothetical protein
MTKTSMEWIDKIFICMDEFYQERWRTQFNKQHPEPLAKMLWQSALYGCEYEEIKSALVLCKYAAKHPSAIPPHQLEFFRYVKGNSKPHIQYQTTKERGDSAIAKGYLDEINGKIRYKKIDS